MVGLRWIQLRAWVADGHGALGVMTRAIVGVPECGEFETSDGNCQPLFRQVPEGLAFFGFASLRSSHP